MELDGIHGGLSWEAWCTEQICEVAFPALLFCSEVVESMPARTRRHGCITSIRSHD